MRRRERRLERQRFAERRGGGGIVVLLEVGDAAVREPIGALEALPRRLGGRLPSRRLLRARDSRDAREQQRAGHPHAGVHRHRRGGPRESPSRVAHHGRATVGCQRIVTSCR